MIRHINTDPQHCGPGVEEEGTIIITPVCHHSLLWLRPLQSCLTLTVSPSHPPLQHVTDIQVTKKHSVFNIFIFFNIIFYSMIFFKIYIWDFFYQNLSWKLLSDGCQITTICLSNTWENVNFWDIKFQETLFSPSRVQQSLSLISQTSSLFKQTSQPGLFNWTCQVIISQTWAVFIMIWIFQTLPTANNDPVENFNYSKLDLTTLKFEGALRLWRSLFKPGVVLFNV